MLANHPTGIADGVILYHVLAKLRPDLYIYTNRDILRIFPQMEDVIAPVEWRPEKRSMSKTRETMDFTRTAIAQGRLGVIFPSGRLAKRYGLRLHERPWMASRCDDRAQVRSARDPAPYPGAQFRDVSTSSMRSTRRCATSRSSTSSSTRTASPFASPWAARSPPRASTRNPRSRSRISANGPLSLAGRHAPNVSLVQTSPLYRLFRRPRREGAPGPA